MKGILLTTSDEKSKAINFLKRTSFINNVDFIDVVNTSFLQSESYQLIAAYSDDEIVGIIGLRHYTDNPYSYFVQVAASDIETIQFLLLFVPKGENARIRVTTTLAAQYLTGLPYAKKDQVDVYFMADKSTIIPVPYGEIIPMGKGHIPLFDGCEGWAKFSLIRGNYSPNEIYALLRDGKVASSAIIGPIFEDPNGEKNVAGIAAFYTEEKYRRKGLGKQLISFLTELLLKKNDTVLYYTTPDNYASQNLARSLGYIEVFKSTDFLWYCKD